jgi:hypothetical protein
MIIAEGEAALSRGSCESRSVRSIDTKVEEIRLAKMQKKSSARANEQSDFAHCPQ